MFVAVLNPALFVRTPQALSPDVQDDWSMPQAVVMSGAIARKSELRAAIAVWNQYEQKQANQC